MKKAFILGLGILFSIGLSTTACESNNPQKKIDGLGAYKETAKANLAAYVEALEPGNYSDGNWTAIEGIANRGKENIDTATTNQDVDTALAATKDAIDMVDKDSNMKWTNENAVYADIKAGFETDILEDIEGSFSTLSFRKVYVAEKVAKNVNFFWPPLVLLFILEDGGLEKQQAFREFLNQDTRITSTRNSRDLPFETVNTRRIERAKDTIAVGETLTLEAKGNFDAYHQPFDFNGLLVKPANFAASKTYTAADFPQVNLKSVEARNNGWLYMELATGGYFNVVKAIDTLSRLSTTEEVIPDKSDALIPPGPPLFIWQISDKEIADFVEGVLWGDYPKAVIKGMKPGKVIVEYVDHSYCEITVTESAIFE